MDPDYDDGRTALLSTVAVTDGEGDQLDTFAKSARGSRWTCLDAT